MHKGKDKGSNKILMQYAGLGAQFIVAIGLGLFLGSKLDTWANLSFPLFVWLLPLIIIIGILIRVIIETNKK